MNKVILMGRLTRDPEVRYSQGEQSTAVARYTLAVDRRYRKDGDVQADFISCVAFGKSAEFAEKYLHKGTKITISGRIQTGSYTNKDGQKVYTTDVVVEDQEFAEKKPASEVNAQQDRYAEAAPQQGGYPGAAPQQGGYPGAAPQQGGYPGAAPQQGGYPGAAPQQGGYPGAAPQQGGYPGAAPQQGGYPGAAPQQGGYYRPAQAGDFMNIPDGIREELPFN